MIQHSTLTLRVAPVLEGSDYYTLICPVSFISASYQYTKGGIVTTINCCSMTLGISTTLQSSSHPVHGEGVSGSSSLDKDRCTSRIGSVLWRNGLGLCLSSDSTCQSSVWEILVFSVSILHQVFIADIFLSHLDTLIALSPAQEIGTQRRFRLPYECAALLPRSPRTTR
jgi:hypothetical protein